jgi:hypothetical protein
MRRDQLAKPNRYFQKLHPTDAAEIDQRREQERSKAAAKARVEAEAKAKVTPSAAPLAATP